MYYVLVYPNVLVRLMLNKQGIVYGAQIQGWCTVPLPVANISSTPSADLPPYVDESASPSPAAGRPARTNNSRWHSSQVAVPASLTSVLAGLASMFALVSWVRYSDIGLVAWPDVSQF